MNAIAENALYVNPGENIYSKFKHAITPGFSLNSYIAPVPNTLLQAVNIEEVFPIIGRIANVSKECVHSDKFKLVIAGGLMFRAFDRVMDESSISSSNHDIDLFIVIKDYIFASRNEMITALEEYVGCIVKTVSKFDDIIAQRYCFSKYALTHSITLKNSYYNIDIQYIKKVYNKPYNVIEGFDIAPCKILWDFETKKYMVHGDAVYAFANRRIKFDALKYSSSYDTRLAKYLSRGFGLEVSEDQYNKVVNNLKSTFSPKKRNIVTFQLGNMIAFVNMTGSETNPQMYASFRSGYGGNASDYGGGIKFSDRYIIKSLMKGTEIRGFQAAALNETNVFNTTIDMGAYTSDIIVGDVKYDFIGIEYKTYRNIIKTVKKYEEFIDTKEFMHKLADMDVINVSAEVEDLSNRVATKITLAVPNVFDNHVFYIEGESGYTEQFNRIHITDEKWFEQLALL